MGQTAVAGSTSRCHESARSGGDVLTNVVPPGATLQCQRVRHRMGVGGRMCSSDAAGGAPCRRRGSEELHRRACLPAHRSSDHGWGGERTGRRRCRWSSGTMVRRRRSPSPSRTDAGPRSSRADQPRQACGVADHPAAEAAPDETGRSTTKRRRRPCRGTPEPTTRGGRGTGRTTAPFGDRPRRGSRRSRAREACRPGVKHETACAYVRGTPALLARCRRPAARSLPEAGRSTGACSVSCRGAGRSPEGGWGEGRGSCSAGVLQVVGPRIGEAVHPLGDPFR